MNVMKTAQIGSISHGTLRTPDLLRAFAASFEGLCDGQTIPPIVAEARGTAELIEECEERCSGQGNTATNAEALGEQEEIGQEVLTDLADNYLSECAPPYCYFGTHDGDGSDFGFWFSPDAFEDACCDGEVLKVGDLSEIPTHLPRGVEYVAMVNDHGNVTLYTPRVEVSEVWAIV
jgi:hypothetical protein